MVLRLDLRPALDFDLRFLADLFNRSFEGYFVPVAESPEALAARLRYDSIDLSLSRVAFLCDDPAGIIYVAVRGWGCRVAGMGVVKEARRRGVGRRLMESALARSRAIGLRRMVLEVIEQNEPAVPLYRGLGFRTLRRLVGYRLEEPSEGPGGDVGRRDVEALAAVDPREVARRVAREADRDLPWQLAAETLAAYGPPVAGYHLEGKAFALVQDAADGTVAHALLVPGSHRRAGWGSRLVRALHAARGRRPWRIPARLPEDLAAGFLTSLGFHRTPLTQLEMHLELGPGPPGRGFRGVMPV